MTKFFKKLPIISNKNQQEKEYEQMIENDAKRKISDTLNVFDDKTKVLILADIMNEILKRIQEIKKKIAT